MTELEQKCKLNRNLKVFRELDFDQNIIIRNAVIEASVWEKAQIEDPQTVRYEGGQLGEHPDYPGLKCYVDGSWKGSDNYSGLGWYVFQDEGPSIIGAKNMQQSLSPLHA